MYKLSMTKQAKLGNLKHWIQKNWKHTVYV